MGVSFRAVTVMTRNLVDDADTSPPPAGFRVIPVTARMVAHAAVDESHRGWLTPCHHSLMARKTSRAKTFVELAAEPTWSETPASRTGKYASRPGGVNPAGEFFDPDGVKLELQVEDASTDQAQQAVDAGAAVVIERCGCGGGLRSCTPRWLSQKDVEALRGGQPPTFTGRYDAPTWLEVWAGSDRAVVFAHGDVSWGDALD